MRPHYRTISTDPGRRLPFSTIAGTAFIASILCSIAAYLIYRSIQHFGATSYCYVSIVVILFALSHIVCAWVSHALRHQINKEIAL